MVVCTHVDTFPACVSAGVTETSTANIRAAPISRVTRYWFLHPMTEHSEDGGLHGDGFVDEIIVGGDAEFFVTSKTGLVTECVSVTAVNNQPSLALARQVVSVETRHL